MISISNRGIGSEATKYYEHLESDHGPSDYYSREASGHFSGAGLEALVVHPISSAALLGNLISA